VPIEEEEDVARLREVRHAYIVQEYRQWKGAGTPKRRYEVIKICLEEIRRGGGGLDASN
jgi:hypothetical protein